MRFTWGFSVGHTYSHGDVARPNSPRTADHIPTMIPDARDAGFANVKSATATTLPITSTAVDDEVEREDDSTWALSDQEHDNDDVLDDGVASDDTDSSSSDESYASEDDLPEDF
jgi:hypothetical protein